MNSMMKVIAVLTMGLSASVAVNAVDGIINFTGSVDSVTCSINGSTPNGAVNMNVGLPSVNASSLSTANAIAGSTPFNIVLGKAGEASCTNGSIAAVKFESGAGVDTPTGLLNNTATTDAAGNVKINPAECRRFLTNQRGFQFT